MINDQELAVLVKLTGSFENNGDPYLGVSGDFDGQGISCGVLQWNIGQGSLQKLVIGAGQNVVMSAMPDFGADLWNACNKSIGQGLAIVRAWQIGKTLKSKPRSELVALMGKPEMKAQQDKYIRVTGKLADDAALAWANAQGKNTRSMYQLAWFFDVYTQNGSLAGIEYSHVQSYIQASSPGKVDDIICDWLSSLPKNTNGYTSAIRNAIIWRNNVKPEHLDLFVFSYLRSQKSNIKWRADVLNRKGTIANLKGWVHDTSIDLTGIIT